MAILKSKSLSQTKEFQVRGVVFASPGGLKGGGGIGSVTRVMTTWLTTHKQHVGVAVIDPRGEGGALWSVVRLPLAAARLISLRLRGFNVLHLQVSERISFPRKGVLLILGRSLGMKTVVHHHGAELIPFYLNAGRIQQRIVQWMIATCGRNIVLGENWRHFLIHDVKAADSRIAVLPNATADLYVGSDRMEADPWHYLVIANLSDRKGIGILLKAVAILNQMLLPVRVTLAGGGEIEKFKLQAADLGVGSICNFTGWLEPEKIHRLLQGGATLVLPSYNEGLPMTILEAFSAGTPVVTTPVGSIPEHLVGEVHCLYVTPGDPQDLAKKLMRLSEDPQLRELLISNSRKLYEDRFTLDGYMRSIMNLYEGL